MHKICLYAIYQPAFARNGGKFIKAKAFQTEAQRQRIIAAFRKYFRRYQSRLKVFQLYEQPGNKLILQWPAKQEVGRLALWLLYDPAHRGSHCDLQGRRQVVKYVGGEDTAEQVRLQTELLQLAAAEIAQGKLWQAKLFRHPGNVMCFAWQHEHGEAYPGDALAHLQVVERTHDMTV